MRDSILSGGLAEKNARNMQKNLFFRGDLDLNHKNRSSKRDYFPIKGS
jgi:hypothetical protein